MDTIEEKVCKKCGEPKPLQKFNVSKACIGGRQHICRKCSVSPEAIARSERVKYARHKETIKERVRRWKEENKEYVTAYTRDNYLAKKERYSEYRKKYYLENKLRLAEQKSKYQRENRERFSEWHKRYREENRERLTAYHAAYYARNSERISSRNKAYRAAHPEVKQLCEARRYARKKAAGGSFTTKQWRELCERYGNICLRCKEAEKLTVDHIVPLSKGGSNELSNIQPLCMRCNVWKSTKIVDFRPSD